jgi:hypothetical protein
METVTARAEGSASACASDFLYEAIKGAGKVGGYLQNILADTVYYAGKYFTYVRSVCTGFEGSLSGARSDEGKITIVRLVRSGAAIDEADKREFYTNFGRDLVEVTKSGMESENLTIIDLSKYEL